jgi:uncharacterized protein
VRLYAWQGPDLFELAFVELEHDRLSARGVQLRSSYRLEYVVETSAMFVSELLRAEVETVHGIGTLDLRRGTKPLRDDVLDLDLQASPLFNSLPVLRDRLHEGGDARDYTMAFVHVPELSVERAQQKYVPLGRGAVRFRSASFTADLEFDREGFVTRYPGLADRVR